MKPALLTLLATAVACLAQDARAQTIYLATIYGSGAGSPYQAISTDANEAASLAHGKCLAAGDWMTSYQISPDPPLTEGDWCVACRTHPPTSPTCIYNATPADVLAVEQNCVKNGGTIARSEAGCDDCIGGPDIPPVVSYCCPQPCCQPKCCVIEKRRCRLFSWLRRRR